MLVTGRPASPHGTMASKYERSVSAFNANPCEVIHRDDTRIPMAAALAPPTQTPVAVSSRSPTSPNSASTRTSTFSRLRRYRWRSFRSGFRSRIG